MKPTTRMAVTKTPDGNEMVLYQHDEDFSIRVEGQVLMHSRQHESELELARLGCAHLAKRMAPSVLIGGLGLGYTLCECLKLVSPQASVTVCELMPELIEWNREFLGGLTGDPLQDKRVTVQQGDVVALLSKSAGEFDAILLDVDNGPKAITDAANHRLYGRRGVRVCRNALTRSGCLAVWSAEPDKGYEGALVSAGMAVKRYRVPAYKGSKSQSRFVWVAAGRKSLLPPGGGEPRKPQMTDAKGGGHRNFGARRQHSARKTQRP